MFASSSPTKLAKKQSLSILSSSSLNQLNNIQVENVKPTKERVISETTGLIKFSLKKPTSEKFQNNNEEIKNLSEVNQIINNYNKRSNENIDEKEENKLTGKSLSLENTSNLNRVPIYVPIDNEDNLNKVTTDGEALLFQMASKQRTILDLTDQLKQAKDELAELEKQYHRITVENISELNNYIPNINVLSPPVKPSDAGLKIRKSASLMDMAINTPRLNTEQFIKTQRQVVETINQLSINIGNNNFISKGKRFFENNLNKNLTIGSGFLNSIFEKQNDDFMDDEDDNDNETSLDETTQNFDYSVDFDLNRLNKIDFDKKLNGVILKEIEEENENENTKELKSISSALSNITDEDYGGDATPI
jgi:hypothetical protein